ncbi:hypothetical protein [Flavobacterium johnsoniae]|uniref:Uncharacterized protein n=1 Tax=Flavobacterium johnsoniae (strain ATCC 17061 / DSM 2064 / JCM 8514 / BCRC 14874 / CCUG 350202 / NBRC 14942 / NCIMB 11054 / UW101) TaxID=376686 RepID=A5FM46_FLAJ1|nr:hypothetical protein [Flavobacterium johnsoniae]ABQ03722.1 hypothetical protein Fjoh_0687 [Flavobacterium johnsoniae UW101]OXG03245.1 hypothetical protein B0A63_00290 [Flavobacterium johnsoniae UW101]WQG79415.1 hypothetical protein SR927_15435 [Flavobacterium johnsoniae UW101]SHK00781.1 hypothetical protein SAMN05444146_0087 [Flavobacterium johnsoniae]
MTDEELPFDNDRTKESYIRDQKIRDILGKEAYLRRERQKLISEKPWYKKPEIIIAIFGVIFPILASYFITSYESDRKELTVLNSNFEPIISESSNFQGNLVISYDSAAVNNISKLTIKLKNTGNVSLVKSDFLDGPVNFQIIYDKNNLSTILQVRKKSDANQQNSELSYKNGKAKSSVIYLPSLLNKGDEVLIEAYFLNTPNARFNVVGKLLNGDIKDTRPIDSKDTKIGYRTFILSINSFFGYKWLTVFICIILFISTSLSSIFQYAMAQDQDLDPKTLIYLIVTITSLIAILSISIMISVLIYI